MHANHEEYMSMALELALKGAGRTSPNPVVGAILVKNGKVVGEGYHKKAGGDHAEISAIKNAGKKSAGADLYVTLEPCCHFGRTPPCCDAIIKNKIKRVFIGMCDPNPIVEKKGIQFLKGKRIEVVSGVLEEECLKINRSYLKWIKSGIPYVTMKAALSLDGKIATSARDSKWITNEKCRNYVHELRFMSDAILVGAGTVLCDNPRLTIRIPGKKIQSKKVIVVDEKLRIPLTSNLFKRKKGELIIAVTNQAPRKKVSEFERRGHKVLLCRSTSDGRVFLPHLLYLLGREGITSILVEGGGEMFSDFIRRNLVDRVVACIAPKILGGEGYSWFPKLSFPVVKKAPQLKDVKIKIFGDNVVLEGTLKGVKS